MANQQPRILDEARLLPHLRGSGKRDEQPAVLRRAAPAPGRTRSTTTKPGWKVPVGDDLERLRGLPDDRPERARLDPRQRSARRDDPAQRAPQVSSRLVYAASGRPLYVEVTSPALELEHGLRFAVLGTEISMTSGRVQWTGEPTGRAPSIEEVTEPRRRVGTHTGGRV